LAVLLILTQADEELAIGQRVRSVWNPRHRFDIYADEFGTLESIDGDDYMIAFDCCPEESVSRYKYQVISQRFEVDDVVQVLEPFIPDGEQKELNAGLNGIITDVLEDESLDVDFGSKKQTSIARNHFSKILRRTQQGKLVVRVAEPCIAKRWAGKKKRAWKETRMEVGSVVTILDNYRDNPEYVEVDYGNYNMSHWVHKEDLSKLHILQNENPTRQVDNAEPKVEVAGKQTISYTNSSTNPSLMHGKRTVPVMKQKDVVTKQKQNPSYITKSNPSTNTLPNKRVENDKPLNKKNPSSAPHNTHEGLYIALGALAGFLLLVMFLWRCCSARRSELRMNTTTTQTEEELEERAVETPGTDPIENIRLPDPNEPQPSLVFSTDTPKEALQNSAQTFDESSPLSQSKPSLPMPKPITLMSQTEGPPAHPTGDDGIEFSNTLPLRHRQLWRQASFNSYIVRGIVA